MQTTPTHASVVIVRPGADALTGDRLAQFVGISDESAGACGLSMQLVVVPPGATAEPHFHPNHETVVYLLRGRVEVVSGERLEHRHVCEAGDFVFTPAGTVHAPRNLSESEPVYLLAARNDPREHEHTVPFERILP